MSIINGFETDVVLIDDDKILRVLLVGGVTLWYLDEELIFSTDWDNISTFFKNLIDDVEKS